MFPYLLFSSLVGIPVGITSAAIGSKLCTITAAIKSISQKLRT